MTGDRVRMLVVLHEATLTGAPMNILHFLRWLRVHEPVSIHTLVLTDGQLRPRFDEVGAVTVLDRHPLPSGLGVLQRGLQQMGSRHAWRPLAAARMLPQMRRLGHFDLVWCNSLTSVSALRYLAHDGVVIAHVHELEVAYRLWRVQHDIELFQTRPDRWIAASGSVGRMLIDEARLPPDRVLVHHEFIDAQTIASRPIDERAVADARKECRIPSDAAVVVGAGTVDWRKGPDLFVQLACEVRRRRRRPVHFVWVGGDLTSPDWERVRSDRDRAGADHVHFVGTRPDPLPWYSMADVFAITSREDPFPLVGLEASALGIPVVTYRNGGMPELLESAGGEARLGIIDHLDVGGMARRIGELLDSDSVRRETGSALQHQVLSTHDVSVAAPRLWADVVSLVR